MKPYYCPHCGKFKWRFQSYVDSTAFEERRVCKHCDYFLIETKEDFKNYLDSKRYKEGGQE